MPEQSPRPGRTWEQQLIRRELIVDDDQDAGQAKPWPNRAARRAAARAARKTTR